MNASERKKHRMSNMKFLLVPSVESSAQRGNEEDSFCSKHGILMAYECRHPHDKRHEIYKSDCGRLGQYLTKYLQAASAETEGRLVWRETKRASEDEASLLKALSWDFSHGSGFRMLKR